MNVVKIKSTGLVYDAQMTSFNCPDTTVVDKEMKALERPERISETYKMLVDEGLVERCHNLPSRYATEKEILLKHSKEHFDFINSLKDKNLTELDSLGLNFDSVYFHKSVSDSSL